MTKNKDPILPRSKRQPKVTPVLSPKDCLAVLTDKDPMFFAMKDEGYMLGIGDGSYFWMGKRFRNVLDAELFHSVDAAQDALDSISHDNSDAPFDRAYIYALRVGSPPEFVSEVNAEKMRAERLLAKLSKTERSLLEKHFKGQ